ncbi:MAG: RusA family crossover junction endodeoxyribonuclease [Thermoguttaceae bacterium]|nr:RusA family crossover junction endodeoxyribonuclease [Thermoguttaceae bacterium]
MTQNIHFRVDGKPITEGSTKAFTTAKGKPKIVHENPNLKAWRDLIKYSFLDVRNTGKRWELTEAAIELKAVFYLKRGGNHNGDLDKLIRAVGDALTGVCYVDDDQIVRIMAEKRKADEAHPEGVEISLKSFS